MCNSTQSAQVWLIPTLKADLKRKLLNCSSQALKLIGGDDFGLFSFEDLHTMFGRATPCKWSSYTNSIQLYSIMLNERPESLWTALQDTFILNERTNIFSFVRNNRTRVGANSFKNRLSLIAEQLYFNDFNLSKDSFKVKCKNIFL